MMVRLMRLKTVAARARLSWEREGKLCENLLTTFSTRMNIERAKPNLPLS